MAPGIDENVLWFQISVKNSVVVKVFNSFENLVKVFLRISEEKEYLDGAGFQLSFVLSNVFCQILFKIFKNESYLLVFDELAVLDVQ